MLNSKIGCVALLGVWFVACGGDDGGSTLKTSVDGSKRVDMLSSTETAQVCMDFESFAKDLEKDLKPKLCKVLALAFSGSGTPDKATCEQAVKECIAAPDDSTDGDMCEIDKDCKATVAEVEKCVNDSFALISTYLDKFPSCAQLADGSGSVPATTPEQPASCKAIATTCPGIASTSDFDDFGEIEE